MPEPARAADGQGGHAGRGADNGSARGRRPAISLIARCASLLIVAMSALWLVRVAPVPGEGDEAALSSVAASLRSGDSYPPDLLRELAERSGVFLTRSLCDGKMLEDLAVVRSALVDIAFGMNDADAADVNLAAAAEAARKSLGCSPDLSGSWAILAWAEWLRNDRTPHMDALLRMSYQTGPYEGWPLMIRSEVGFRLYPDISEDHKAMLSAQLNWLLNVGQIEPLAQFYLAGNDAQKALLVSLFVAAEERTQKRVADYVRAHGEDISLPLVAPLGRRPWQ